MDYKDIYLTTGLKFKHKSGEIYEILHIANLHAEIEKRKKFPITIVYKRLSDNTIWTRPYSLWGDNFELIISKDCKNKVNGSCTLHNIFCSFPDCES